MRNHTDDMEDVFFDNSASGAKDAKRIPPRSPNIGPTQNKDNTSADDQEKEAPKERAGVILKRVREARGLSLEIVHEATKIPMDALRAIEEGYKIRLLSPFYFKGFIKMYAGYLDVDIAQVIDGYQPEELPPLIKQDVETLEAPLWVKKVLTKENKRRLVIAVGIILALFLLSKIVGFLAHLRPFPQKPRPVHAPLPTRSAKTAVKTRVVSAPAVSKKEETGTGQLKEPVVQLREETRRLIPATMIPRVPVKAEPAAAKPTAPKEESAPVSPVSNKDIALSVRAKQNSWLRVKTDGNVVFQSTLRLGDVETWFADEEIEISGKNINQLDFELNGKMIGVLGRNDRNAKKVVVTKNGLSVKK